MAAITVLALTGFSTGRGHGTTHSRHGSGHGGGCSSSSQRQNGSGSAGSSTSSTSSSSSDDEDDDYGSGYRGGYHSGTNRRGVPTPRATGTGSAASDDGYSSIKATVVSCVSAKRPWSTVRLTNSGSESGTYLGTVSFYDKDGAFLDFERIDSVRVPGGKKKTLKIKPSDPHGVVKCVLEGV
ncbi:hypothetical protein [Streptomyces sp. NPDC088923]|uniref:hypothetical protein n=1 Tax=Streptomyces sp. NPDC088923 TaxID=3365913 RepID=UPI00380D47BE